MPITLFTGPPGSGKSHALVKDVVLPAVKAGRRVLSNIDGLNPDAIRGYWLQRLDDVTSLGTVELFHGEDAQKPGFWPDEDTPDTQTRVKAGDLVVFDEWALYFPRRGKLPDGCNVVGFLRWHRHLTNARGQATDIAIGTQLATDMHDSVRGLIATSYKFRKMTALGASGTYAWFVYQGHLQPKNGHYRNGTGTYDKEVFPLYASSAAAKEGTHVELRTNKRESIWSGWQAWAVVIGAPILMGGGALALWSAYSDATQDPAPKAVDGAVAAAGAPQAGAPVGVQQPAGGTSPWRIVGHIDGEYGTRVILADDKGATRIMMPGTFDFDQGRPISGTVDGRTVLADDRLPQAAAAPPLPVIAQ